MINATSKSLMVIVTLRSHAKLEELTRIDGRLATSCGSIGTALARRLAEENGRVVMPARNLLAAFDTQDGVSAMTDNFEFTVERTLSPLFFQLLLSR